jgi:hypothetical protein
MSRRIALLAFVLLGCETEQHALAHEVAPATWVPDADECGQCHEAIAEQWARSRHHAAFTNPDFARSFAREPLDFCRDCHAPALPRLAASEAEHLGVGCIDCHFDGETLLASGASTQPSAAPHALRRSPDFATQSCARCHEFDFPAQSFRRGSMMQTTMREHRASAHSDRACADCHMRDGDHEFASTREPETMRRAVSITARREGDALVLTLTPVEVGHAFPTGDLFRRLELHAELVSPEGETLASTTRYLARHFAPRRHRDGRLNHAAMVPVIDDRLTGPTTIRLELDESEPGAELRWWVDYERVDDRDSHEPERSTLAEEIRLAEGSLRSAD